MRSLLLSLLLIAACSNAFAQEKYTEKLNNDEVDIQYKWKYPMKGGVPGPAELLLKVKNKDDDPISISFEVAYTLDMKTVGTFAVDTCMKANKTIYGKMNGLYYVAPDLSNEQIRSDGFQWEINDLAIEEIDKCPVDK